MNDLLACSFGGADTRQVAWTLAPRQLSVCIRHVRRADYPHRAFEPPKRRFVAEACETWWRWAWQAYGDGRASGRTASATFTLIIIIIIINFA